MKLSKTARDSTQLKALTELDSEGPDAPLATDFHKHCMECDKCTDGTGAFCKDGAILLLILVDKMSTKHKSKCEVCGTVGSDLCFIAQMTKIPEVVGGIYSEVARNNKLINRQILYGDPTAESPKGFMKA